MSETQPTKEADMASNPAPCSPKRWIKCKAFVEVMGRRAEVDFSVQSNIPCEGACESLARKNDEAIARYVAGASMKSGIEVVESYWENAKDHTSP